MRLTDDHLQHHLEHGYVLVEGFMTDDELSEAREAIEHRSPGFFAYAADPENVPQPKPSEDASLASPLAPMGVPALDRITFHPEIRAYVSRYLGGDAPVMQGGILQLRVASPEDKDQVLHWDYGGHTLAWPSADRAYAQIPCIAYYTDVTADTAPTYVVSRTHYPDDIGVPSWLTEERPDLYGHELPVEAPAGSLLLYSVRTYHRGSAFKKPGARAVQFFTYSSARYPWMGISGHAGRAGTPEMQAFLVQSSVEERTALGFPRPGDPYWSEQTIRGVSARYPDMDMAPYVLGVSGRA